MNIFTQSVILAVLLFCSSVHAGSAPASSSKIQGVFLGFSTDDGLEAYLEPGQPKEYIDGFKNACKSKKRIWALGIPNTFVCTNIEYIPEAGNGAVYSLQLTAKEKRASANNAVVFSLEPLTLHKPNARALESSEAKGLLSVYKSSALTATVERSIAASSVQILDFHENASSIYVVKWKQVKGELSTNDYFLVINRDGETYFSAGNFNGTIVGFVDVNGDGIPEVQRSIDCDGTCEAISSLYKNTKDLVSIYNH